MTSWSKDVRRGFPVRRSGYLLVRPPTEVVSCGFFWRSSTLLRTSRGGPENDGKSLGCLCRVRVGDGRGSSVVRGSEEVAS